ncbi:DUF4438 domain-containing protein [Massilia sp. S19_KUP03_FR1]|uniref:DUF4438 domain-containing protein n=1 Tax=Massilia sp. S19_KUP03_FR1 TaxID=3025503 RepID=UPI002FCDC872
MSTSTNGLHPMGHGPRMNLGDLAIVAVAGQIAHPIGQANPYRIGNDGVPRILPGTGGIVLNHRIGDRCVGLAGDHIEPGVALHNNGREVVGPRDGPNNALLAYACIGNRARVISGPCLGSVGRVTGKHGGINHVLVDFAPGILRRLCIGDRIQIVSHGLGLALPDHPDITVLNASPGLLQRWGLHAHGGQLQVPVTHLVPGALMGSGLGKNTGCRGDYDIQLSDPGTRQRYRLDSLRFGDLVAVVDVDMAFGGHYRRGHVTVGVIVHGDSTVAGHGPGLAPLLTGPARVLRPVHGAQANLAEVYGLRHLGPARRYLPIHGRARTQQRMAAPVRSRVGAK